MSSQANQATIANQILERIVGLNEADIIDQDALDQCRWSIKKLERIDQARAYQLQSFIAAIERNEAEARRLHALCLDAGGKNAPAFYLLNYAVTLEYLGHPIEALEQTLMAHESDPTDINTVAIALERSFVVGDLELTGKFIDIMNEAGAPIRSDLVKNYHYINNLTKYEKIGKNSFSLISKAAFSIIRNKLRERRLHVEIAMTQTYDEGFSIEYLVNVPVKEVCAMNFELADLLAKNNDEWNLISSPVLATFIPSERRVYN
jgi:hypothetical protein